MRGRAPARTNAQHSVVQRGLQSRLRHPEWLKKLGDDVCRRITELAVCGGPEPDVAISNLTRYATAPTRDARSATNADDLLRDKAARFARRCTADIGGCHGVRRRAGRSALG